MKTFFYLYVCCTAVLSVVATTTAIELIDKATARQCRNPVETQAVKDWCRDNQYEIANR